MEVMELLTQAVEQNAADIFLVPGMPFSYKIGGRIICQGEEKIMPDQLDQMITRIYEIAKNRSMERVLSHGDDDFSFAIEDLARFRVNSYFQRGSQAAVIRVVSFRIPDYKELGIPEEVIALSKLQHGMIIISGTAGSGKSTTQACIIDAINKEREAHIITLEDPIEYIYEPDQCIINQREIGKDTRSYADGLRSILREDPDVILIGEMRDLNTIETALTAAETGHLVFATLHTNSAADSVDRMVNVFPEGQQRQIRLQLSTTLRAVLSQQLLPKRAGGRAAACEVMMVNSAIKNLIREGKTPQIDSFITMNAQDGSITMDNALLKMVREGTVTYETALGYARDREAFSKGRRG